jgi:hypothetical protein
VDGAVGEEKTEIIISNEEISINVTSAVKETNKVLIT